jgi:hypothetical protein
MKVHVEVLKLIQTKDACSYKEAMKLLQKYIVKATGKEYVKGSGGWKEVLEKTRDYLRK